MSDQTSDDTTSSDSGSGSDNSGASSGNDSGSDKGKNWLEWTITVLGGALVLFVLGFVGYEWATDTGEPADLVITLDPVERDGTRAEIPVSVENTGGRVAEAAVIEVCAGPDACAQLTFDYIPFKSTVDGRVGLEAPLPGPLSSRVVSFRNP